MAAGNELRPRPTSGDELATAREALGLSLQQLADALCMGAGGAMRLREMERGKRDLTGPISVAVGLMLYARELEIELGINSARNAELAELAGKPVSILEAVTTPPRDFKNSGD